MSYIPKKIFEFIGVKSNIDNIHNLIWEFSDDYTEEELKYRLYIWIKKREDCYNACVVDILGRLGIDEKSDHTDMGFISMASVNDELVNIRSVCREADLEWVVNYFIKLGEFLRKSLGPNINFKIFTENKLNIQDEKPNWFPKTDETFNRWKMVYEIIKTKELEFKELEPWEIQKPKPKISDLVDAVKIESSWTYSERTIRRIRKAGRSGWLD